jgi:hypothetical protein
MKNIKTAIKGNILTITVDLSKTQGRSKAGTGPNEIIATTGGHVDVPNAPAEGTRMGINIYKPAEG